MEAVILIHNAQILLCSDLVRVKMITPYLINETELEIFDAVAMVLVVLPVHPLSFVRKYGEPLLL